MQQTRLMMVALVITLSIVGFSAPAAATSDAEDVVYCTCHIAAGDTAHISFSSVSNVDLWSDASEYAEVAIDKCNLDNREQKELAGEIRAHVLGDPIPGAAGPTIDMGNTNDPQIDKYGYLM